MRLEGARVAITGASSGIGAAAALEFARRGASVGLAARSSAPLEDVAARCKKAGSPRARMAVVDVRERDHVQAWASSLDRAWQGVDVVVANAGIGQYGAFLDAPADHLEQIVQTNLLGVWHTVQAFAPALEKSRGQVVVVGSVAGKVPLPYMSAYAGTKWALTGWSRSARPELQRRGIGLTLVCPGATRTPFADNALHLGKAQSRLDERLDGLGRGQTAEGVARAIARATAARRKEVNLSVDGRLGVAVSKFAPHAVSSLLARWMRPG